MHLHPSYLKGFPWNVLRFPQHSESPTPNAWVQAHEGPLGPQDKGPGSDGRALA